MPTLENLRVSINQVAQRAEFADSKLTTIEKHLPTLIEELLEMYFEKKIVNLQETFVSQKSLKEQLALKLDTIVFKDFERLAILADNTKETGFIVNDRLIRLERGMAKYPTRIEMLEGLEGKAASDNVIKMIEDLKVLTREHDNLRIYNEIDRKNQDFFSNEIINNQEKIYKQVENLQEQMKEALG
jgi:hypothetical protein